MVDRFSEERMIKLCYGLWEGGYFEGNPLDPYSISSYHQMGFISVLHAIYKACIKPFVNSDTVVLEIGPGRGAWTKTMLSAKKIWCLDVLSARHNNFWEYIGLENKRKVKYIQVNDFSCRDLPDDYFDFIFSFGTFCHIPWEGQCKYYRALYPKMRKGGIGMIMFGDFDKFNASIRKYKDYNVFIQRFQNGGVFNLIENIIRNISSVVLGWKRLHHFSKLLQKHNNNNIIPKDLWFHAGINETRQFLEDVGWEVVNPDVDWCLRDPIVHFRKPLRERKT